MDFIHIGLVSSTADNAERFYGELLGLDKTRTSSLPAEFAQALFGVEDGCEIVYYGSGALVFEIFLTGRREPADGKISHTCIAVDDLQGLRQRCQQMGFGVREARKGDKVVVFLEDADGNLFEVKSRS